MAQYKTGSVNVTNGSATVTGVDTLWSAEVSAGDIFTIVGDNAWYEVGSVGSNTSITLTSTYAGSTASGAQYAISRDFTTNKSIPYPQKGDIETASLLKRAMNIIDNELSTGFDSSNVTITGGTINGTTIGGTTAAAVSATTLTTSSTVTLNGGTANGVAYLNGSKVLTTGSALTFDGSKLTVKGGNAGQFVLDNANEQYVQQLFQRNATANTGADFLLDGSGNTFNFRTLAAGMPFTWQISASAGSPTEQMRLTSTGLGIGTSSPGSILDVVGAGNPTLTLRGSAGAYTSFLKLQAAGGGGSVINATGASADTLTFQITNAEQMRLSSTGLELKGKLAAGYTDFSGIPTNGAAFAGSVGIGTSSPSQKLTVSASASDVASFISGDTNCDVYFKASGTTLGNTRLRATGGDLVFITGLNDRMRLDSSGNLGLGVTPSAWNAYKAFQFGRQGVIFGDAGGGTAAFGSNLYWNSGWKYIVTEQASYYSQASGTHAWYTAPSGTAGNAISFSQAMTLDASGRLGVGTTSPSFTLVVASSDPAIQVKRGALNGILINQFDATGNSSINLVDNAALIFGTNNTERARIDSSGNLIQTVNTTAATLATNNTLTFSIVDNSTLRISVRGSDGTTRTATVALT